MGFDPLMIGIVACVGFTFVVIAMMLGQALIGSGDKTPSVSARVEKLSKLPDELKKELVGMHGGTSPKESLFAKVDLKPLTGEAYLTRLEQRLAQADIPLRVSEFLIMRVFMIVVGAALVMVLTKNIIFGLLAALPLMVIHIPVMNFLTKRRVRRFSDQLAPFLILVVNSLRAGQTFMQGADVASSESPDPIASEFKQILKEVNLGMPVEASMDNMLTRVPSEDLKIVVAAYTIQRKVGGNLATIFETTAATIRERIRIQGQINTLTTQGKLSGAIVALIPFVIGGIIATLMPQMMKDFVQSFAGKVCIGIALVMQCIGALAIKKIVSIEI
ncbi:MAG: type II secretion system F family protein [Verrucomicrobiota bacterium]